jgi:hypothetical protein
MKPTSVRYFFALFCFTLVPAAPAQLVRSASGPNALSIQGAVDAFRLDLGTLNATSLALLEAAAARSTGMVSPTPLQRRITCRRISSILILHAVSYSPHLEQDCRLVPILPTRLAPPLTSEI